VTSERNAASARVQYRACISYALHPSASADFDTGTGMAEDSLDRTTVVFIPAY